MEEYKAKARILVEALPYIRKFHGSVVVVKYGGNVMTSLRTQRQAMTDIVLLKHVGIHPIVVHGGGPEASRMMREAGIEPRFIDGLRVTDGATIEIVRRAFGIVNERICGFIKKAGAKPVGLIPPRHSVFTVRPKDERLGFVGEVTEVDQRVVLSLLRSNYIPVLAPLGMDAGGQIYNVNADTAATALAVAIRARKLTLMTNVPSVMDGDRRINRLDPEEARRLIKKGIITGGMIPKVEAAIHAVKKGVRQVHLIDGTTEHSILIEIFTRKGIGTLIVP